jgi:glycosyltransferase involved in cell wall biosynthesis
MGTFVSGLLTILAVAVAVPTAVLGIEILAAILRPQVSVRLGRDRRRIAVLVPARNESSHIAPTLEDIKAQLRPDDLLLVVANNCTDDTAEIARKSGAEVVERHDPERIGKGYALDWGLRHLESNPPEIVIMIDADCRLAEGAIDYLTAACFATGRPVQALYLMTAPDGSRINQQIAEFAWRVKNWVRPLGLKALALPCQLMGAGMAFPWQVIRAADLAHPWIVEDLKLGIDLAAAGHPPLFCPAARVLSQFATSVRGADIQRRRWEHGHIVTILKLGPRSLYLAVTRGNINLLGLTLDLVVPPLSLLVVLLLLIFTLSAVAALVGLKSAALIVSSICLVGLTAVVFLAWLKYGRDVLPPRAILSLPAYVLRKLGLYRQVLFGKMTSHWVGTDRAKS